MLNMSNMQNFFNIRCHCFVKNKLYFMCWDFNILCCLDIDKNCIEYVCEIKEEEAEERNLYSDIKFYNNKLILIPANAKKIALFDISLKKVTRIPLKEFELSNESGNYRYSENTEAKFCTSVMTKNKLYLIAQRYPAIIELNLDTLKARHFTDWLEGLYSFKINNFAYFREDIIIKDNYIFCKSTNSKAALKFDCSCNKSYIINKNNFIDVDYEKISDLEKNILLLNIIETPLINEYKELYLNTTKSAFLTGKFIELEKYLFYVPFKFNVLLRYEKETQKTDMIRLGNKYLYFFDDGNDLLGWDRKESRLINFGYDGNDTKESIVRIDINNLLSKKINACTLKTNEADGYFSLKNYVSVLVSDQFDLKNVSDNDNVGMKIHKKIIDYAKKSKEI